MKSVKSPQILSTIIKLNGILRSTYIVYIQTLRNTFKSTIMNL